MTVQCDQDDKIFHTVKVGGEERGSGRHLEGGEDAEGGGEGHLSQEGGKDGEKQNPVGRVMAPPKEGKPVNVFCYMAKNN